MVDKTQRRIFRSVGVTDPGCLLQKGEAREYSAVCLGHWGVPEYQAGAQGLHCKVLVAQWFLGLEHCFLF